MFERLTENTRAIYVRIEPMFGTRSRAVWRWGISYGMSRYGFRKTR